MTLRSVVIVGASLAGHATARALRHQGFDGSLTLIGAETHRPYDRPPLSKDFLTGALTEDDLALEGSDENLDAEWLLGRRATALDTASRTVTLEDGTRVEGDAVVVATGSAARRLPRTPPGVLTLRTLDDAVALRAALQPGARLVVIGAGFIGAEVAATAAARGLDVTVVEAADTPLAGPLGTWVGAAVAGLHARNGVRLICGVPVATVTGTDRPTGVTLADGTHLPADVVVAGVGAAPAVDWLAGSGLDLSNGLVCSSLGATVRPRRLGRGRLRRLARHRPRGRPSGWSTGPTPGTGRSRWPARCSAVPRRPPCAHRTSGPTSTGCASSSPAAVAATRPSASRPAAPRAPTCSPSTVATARRSRCWG